MEGRLCEPVLDVVKKYEARLIADECEPEVPLQLWAELADVLADQEGE